MFANILMFMRLIKFRTGSKYNITTMKASLRALKKLKNEFVYKMNFFLISDRVVSFSNLTEMLTVVFDQNIVKWIRDCLFYPVI